MQVTGNQLRRAAGALAILVVGLIVYAPSFGASLVWDDGAHFASNPTMHGLRGLFEIWTSRSALYFPLTLTTFWTLYQAFGAWPLPYHAVTIAFHLANALLLWALLGQLRVRGSWLAAFLFAVHPIHVESVAWVSELKNTQSGFFFLLTLLALARGRWFDEPAGDRRWRFVALGLFGAALLSKTSTVMLPAVLLVILTWRGRVKGFASVDWTFPFFLLAALAASWTIWEQRHSSGASGFEWSQSPVYRLALAAHIAWFYVGKLLWPEPLVFVYPKFAIDVAAPATWLPLAGGVALIAALFAIRRAWSWHALGAVFAYLALIFPVMGFFNIYFMRYAYVADHFVYLGAMPLTALAAAAIASLGWSRAPLAALALSACCFLARQHTHAFHDEHTLWRDTLEKNPGAWMVRNNLGASLMARGDLDAALAHFIEALKFNPRHYEALCNVGNIHFQQGDFDAAIAFYTRALELRPDFPLVLTNLGLAHDRKGDLEQAVRAYREALSFDPRFLPAQELLASALERSGRHADAVAAYVRILDLRQTPGEPGAVALERRAADIAMVGRTNDAALYRDAAERYRRTGPRAP